jgi:hypothetical protein
MNERDHKQQPRRIVLFQTPPREFFTTADVVALFKGQVFSLYNFVGILDPIAGQPNCIHFSYHDVERVVSTKREVGAVCMARYSKELNSADLSAPRNVRILQDLTTQNWLVEDLPIDQQSPDSTPGS